MKSFFFSRISKFNVLMTLGILSLTTIILPVIAAPQEAPTKTSTGDIVREKLVSQAIPKRKIERVRFAKGKTSTVLTRTILADGSMDFIINAKKGQTIEFTVGYDFQDSDIESFLTEPRLQDISLSSGPKKRNEFVTRKTGDHVLTVNNTTRKKITIALYLDIN